jgi:2-dehydropantoate 2-reductase
VNVLIIGAGALGLLFGGYLSQSTSKITYVTRNNSQAKMLNDKGVVFYPLQGEATTFRPAAFSFDQDIGHIDNRSSIEDYHVMKVRLVIVTVKQTNLDKVLPWIRMNVGESVPLLFLMNGMGHHELAHQQLPHNHIYFGTTQSGATRLSPNEVEERGRSITKIGSMWKQACHPSLLNLMDKLDKKGIHLQWSEEIEVEMWRKCVINSCINPLTALFQVKNGTLIEDPALHTMMDMLYKEASMLIEEVIPQEAPKILRNGKAWEDIQEVCRITSENLSSMVQDIRHKRETEIESITGYLLSKAEEKVQMPTHSFVYQSIRFLQKQTKE